MKVVYGVGNGGKEKHCCSGFGQVGTGRIIHCQSPGGQPDLEDLKRQTKNLYRYRVGNVVVEFDYLHNGRTVNDLFALMVQAGM